MSSFQKFSRGAATAHSPWRKPGVGSRGVFESPGGRQQSCRSRLLSPLPGLTRYAASFPLADARGYVLSPLRGLRLDNLEIKLFSLHQLHQSLK